MRRVGLVLIAALGIGAAGGGAAVLVAGEARADSVDTTEGTTTATTSTTVATTTTTTTSTTTYQTTTRQTTTGRTTTVTSTRRKPPPPPPPARRRTVRSSGSAAPPAESASTPVRRTRITRSTPALRGGPYVFPVYGPVSFTDTFGAPRADTTWHHGDDIFAPLGAPVVAVTDGTLFLVGWNRVGGNRLWLRDRRGNYFYYAHLSAFSTLATSGGRVRAGTVLGFVGNSGDARGTPFHLHFEIHPATLIRAGYDASAVDPTRYLRAWKRARDIRLSTRDSRTTRAAGWSASVALPSAAPSAGAVLLQATDISRATGLRPKAVREALVVPAHEGRVQPLWHAPERAGVRPALPLGRRARKQSRKAERLDRGAELPPGFGLPGMTVWDTLAECEAGGDWNSKTGNGYYGGLQFAPGTWLAHGGGEFAPSAEQATREQQIIVAERVLRDQGWAAWPACSLKLGLRR